eukprot:scaffold1068_cov375-Prasinococcus_capsulatus_cf.AAC.17
MPLPPPAAARPPSVGPCRAGTATRRSAGSQPSGGAMGLRCHARACAAAARRLRYRVRALTLTL